MLREIITVSKSVLTLQIPEDMQGKTLEVIAFEIDAPKVAPGDKKSRIKAIEAITGKYLIDLSNYKFNRDEANDYEQ
jgi:hypothetical protein